MRTIFEYTLFRIKMYYLNKKEGGSTFTACLTVSFFIWLMILDLIILLCILFRIDLSTFNKEALSFNFKLVFVIYLALVPSMFYLKYKRKELTDTLIEKYDDEKLSIKKRNGFLIIVSFIILFAIPITYSFLRK